MKKQNEMGKHKRKLMKKSRSKRKQVFNGANARETRSIAKFKQRFCLNGSVLFSVCLDPPYIQVVLDSGALVEVFCWNTVYPFQVFVANIKLEIR